MTVNDWRAVDTWRTVDDERLVDDGRIVDNGRTVWWFIRSVVNVSRYLHNPRPQLAASAKRDKPCMILPRVPC